METLALTEFLKQCPPLESLPESELQRWVATCRSTYWRAGETILARGTHNQMVSLIRSGAVAAYDDEDQLVNLIGEKEWFGYRSVLKNGRVSLKLVAWEDTLAYQFPADLFLAAYQQYEAFPTFFAHHKPQRLQSTLKNLDLERLDLCSPLDQHSHPLHTLPVNAPTYAAARALNQHPTLLVVQNESQHPHALIDDRHLRQAMAQRIQPDAPLQTWLSAHPPLQLPATYPLGKALVRLLEKGQQRALVKTESGWQYFDLSQLTTRTPAWSSLTQQIHQAQNLAELHQLSKQAEQLFIQLAQQRMDPIQVAAILSALYQAITAQTVRLCQAEQGPPPIPYAFVITGSLARKEQAVKTDQDNAMVLHDRYCPSQHGAYFEQLAKRINHALSQLGFAPCPGEVMAQNPRWRQPLSVWQTYFHQWINEPNGEALLQASIFFDMIAIVDDHQLVAPMMAQVLDQAEQAGLFLHHMASNALRFRPPLGFFRQLILDRDGQRQPVLNLKKGAIAPIVELARVHALAGGIRRLNSISRLRGSAQQRIISQDGYENLRDVWILVNHIRQQHQAQQLLRQTPPDNLIQPDQLSYLEQRHLKDAFAIIGEMQEALALRLQNP